MANIPIKKLKEGSTSYYPLSVGESVVTTKDITVASDIGGYRKNDKINKVSNLDVILNKLLGEPAAVPVIDTALSNTSTNAVQNKAIKAAIDKKVEETIGESKVWNEASGGGAMYTSASTGIKSFVGVNNPASTGGIAGIAGQLYVIKGDEKTKLNMYNGKFCYVKGNNPTTDDEKAKRELVVQEDLNSKVDTLCGESKIWNEASGGGAMYTSASTGIKSYVGVNNPALTEFHGIAGQLYVIKGRQKTKLNMYDGKFCYVHGDNPTTDDEKAKRELVVQEDLNATKLIEIVEGMTAAQKTKFKEALGL